ncbi:helix-turn-helix domain-containing protein [Galactobacter valiniphilus]|nr:helix-turn-helix transcriptional regulator [Galactobacter valiniphilus]
MATRTSRRRWKEGTYMRLRDPKTLANLMKNRGYTQASLAREVYRESPVLTELNPDGTPKTDQRRSSINHLLSGKNKGSRPIIAERIAEALGVDLDYLYEVHVPADAKPTPRRNATAKVAA